MNLEKRYNMISNNNCFCVHTNTNLFLNLNKLPDLLFYQRWQKDPNNFVLTQQFNLFCGNNTSRHLDHSTIEIVEDYEYLLTKILYEIKNLVKKHPELSKEFYFTNHTLLENKLKIIHQTHQTKDNTLQNVINNPKKNNNFKKKGIYN